MHEISGFLRGFRRAVFWLWPSACTCHVIGMLQKVCRVCSKQSTRLCHQTQKAEHLGNEFLELLRDDGAAE